MEANVEDSITPINTSAQELAEMRAIEGAKQLVEARRLGLSASYSDSAEGRKLDIELANQLEADAYTNLSAVGFERAKILVGLERDNLNDQVLSHSVMLDEARFNQELPTQTKIVEDLDVEDSIEFISGNDSNSNSNPSPNPRKLLNGLFVERNDNTFFRIDSKSPALVDEGQKLKIVNKDIETFQAAIELAHSKGWKAIQVKGSSRFRAEAWYQASLLGVQVEGYTPNDKDLKRLAENQHKGLQTQEEREVFQASLSAAENFVLERDGGIVYPDSINENRSFAGKVIKSLDSHVIQDIGRNTFAIHEKAKVGNPEIDVRLNIKYKGRDVEVINQKNDRSNSITR